MLHAENLPDGWREGRVKNLIMLDRKGCWPASETTPDGAYPFYSSSQTPARSPHADFDGEYLVIGDGGIVNAHHVSGRFSASDHTLLYRTCGESDLRFAYYWVQANADTIFERAFVGMGIKNLNRDRFASLPVWIPPYSTQRRIADYLDAETAKIDALSAELTEFAETLRAWQRSVIAECVTRGVPCRRAGRAMKPSGIDWIGEVPEDWDIRRLAFQSRVTVGFPFPAERFNREIGHPIIRIRDITPGSTSTFVEDHPWIGSVEINAGDILVGMDGDFPTARWKSGPALLNQRVCHISGIPGRMSDNYLSYVLPEALNFIKSTTQSSVFIKHIGKPDIKDMIVPVPSVEEQEEIASHLSAVVKASESVSAEIRVSTDLLAAYRRSVISEAIMGRLGA